MKAIQSIAQVVEDVENTNPIKLPDDFTVFVPKATDDNYGVVKLSQIDDKVNAHNISPTAHQDIRDELATKQDKLTAGKNIEISNDNVISSVPAKYTAGENIEITDNDVINAKPYNISFDPHVILQQDLLTKVAAAPQDYVFTYNSSLVNSVPRVYRYAYKSVPDDIIVYTNVTDKVYKLTITSKNNELVVNLDSAPLGKTYTAGSNIDISDSDVISAKNVVSTDSDSIQTTKGELNVPGVYLGGKHLTEAGVSANGKTISYPDITADDTFATKNNVDAQIAGIRKNIAYTFDTYIHFTQWLEGKYTRDDGVVAESLDIGDSIYIAETNIPDYWVYTKHSPMTIDDFKPYESKIDLKDMVSIAGNQTITGNKDFTGKLTKTGDDVATVKEAQKVLTMSADGVEETTTYVFTVADSDSYLPYRQTGTKFVLDLHLPVAGALNLNKPVAITFGDTSYHLYNILKGNTAVTIGELSQVDKYNATGYRFIFEAIYFETTDLTGFYIVPTVSMNDVMSLTSDELDDYAANGGLTAGQLAICSKVITNSYTQGHIYRFDVTYPSTYVWTDLTDAGGLTVLKESDFPLSADLLAKVNANPQNYCILRGSTIYFYVGETTGEHSYKSPIIPGAMSNNSFGKYYETSISPTTGTLITNFRGGIVFGDNSTVYVYSNDYLSVKAVRDTTDNSVKTGTEIRKAITIRKWH